MGHLPFRNLRKTVSVDMNTASFPRLNTLAILGIFWCCLVSPVGSSPPETSEGVPLPEEQGANVVRIEDHYVCVGRDASGEVFEEQHPNLLDAINRACTLAGEGTEERPAQIEILTSGDSGAHIRKGGRFGITPLSHQTLDFHSHLYTVINSGTKSPNLYGFYIGRVSDDKTGKDPRSHITIKNLRITGNPRTAVLSYYSDHITIENLDIELPLDESSGLNIRHGKNITLKGDLYVKGGKGQQMDIVHCSQVTIGDVTVTHSKEGCGVLLSNNYDVTVGNVFGYKNEPGGSYATLRFANGNVDTEVAGAYSRNSGKGIMVSSGEAGWKNRDPESGWQTPGNHNNVVHKADILRSWGPNVFMNEPSSNNEVTYSVLRDTTNWQGGGVTMIKGEGNLVNEDVLPDVVIDPSREETVRINELRFGFNDCSPYEYCAIDGPDKYVRDRSCDGYGYAQVPRAKGSEMSWCLNGGEGSHQLAWRYASKSDCAAQLYINGELVRDVSFPGTGSETEWATASVSLGAVVSERKLVKIVATTDQGLPFIDFLEVTGPGVQASLLDKERSESKTGLAR